MNQVLSIIMFFNFFHFFCLGIEQAITITNTSDQAIIVGLTSIWCEALEQETAQTLLNLYLKRLANAYVNEEQSQLIAPREFEMLCFCALLSPGGSVTYRPEKYSMVLGTRFLDAFVWDLKNNKLGSQRNIVWGTIVNYPKSMVLETLLGKR